jgi:hypothetical protein
MLVVGALFEPVSGVTIGLVILTAYYAWQTKLMVEDARRGRKIEFLNKRLESLYTPLLYFMDETYSLIEKMKLGMEFEEEDKLRDLKQLFEERRRELVDIKRHTHLASEEALPLLEEFINAFSDFVTWYEENLEVDPEGVEELERILNKTKEQIERDWENIRKSLVELIE